MTMLAREIQIHFYAKQEEKGKKKTKQKGVVWTVGGEWWWKGRSQTSVDAGSVSVKTLYNLLLIAGPILRSVSAPLRFADF